MERFRKFVHILFLLFTYSCYAHAQDEHIVSSLGNQIMNIPIHLVDSIQHSPSHQFLISLKDSTLLSDTLSFNRSLPDTLIIDYQENKVLIQNPRLFQLQPLLQGSDVTIIAKGKQPFVCLAKGDCSDGRLIIDSDTTCTLVLDGLNLSSKKGSTICFPNKQKVKIELVNDTKNILSDCSIYKTDSTDFTNSCLYSKGSLTFVGKGTLEITGNYHHAIASGIKITIKEGHIIICNAIQDGLHCDNIQIDGGTISLHLSNDASKGIKCKEDFIMTDGSIEGKATGDVIIENGETTYCTLLKCGGSMTIENGNISLVHQGMGGRCISVDGNLHISGGHYTLENHGNGNSYLTVKQDSDYYTPKCVTVNGCTYIERGIINLLATGNGGKGLDCSNTLFIGRQGDDFIPEDSLFMKVETRGTALVDNVVEDYRRGCPKAIKADNDVEVYSGTLHIYTLGQGGEGIESKGSFRSYKATIIADCFDDGINTGKRFVCYDSHIYCMSYNNDGIDSNGKCTIIDGIVAAISEHPQNESIDTEGDRLYLYGGQIIGIGNHEVEVNEDCIIPYYSTQLKIIDNLRCGDNININNQRYLTLHQNSKVILSLFHEHAMNDVFITVASSKMKHSDTYSISDSDKPIDYLEECLESKVVIGGTIYNLESLFNFKPN